MTRATPLRAAALLAAAFWLAGCGPKLVRQRIYDQPTARVEVRHREQGGEVLAQGHSHPATISDVRIAHILGNLSFQDADEKQRPVIRSADIYPLGEGIAKAFEQAGPDDEVAAAAFPVDRRLGIFTDERVTAFRVWLEGDDLRFEFFEIEAPLEKDGAKLSYREWEIPGEKVTTAPAFKLVPGEAQTRMGPDGVSVAWRDDYFRKPVALRDREGKGRRRTVLMELPPEKTEGATAPAKNALPSGLSDAQIRALDMADADRSNGQITEAEYQHRRRLILENRLDEAGYGASP
jgi:hypothetical protein